MAGEWLPMRMDLTDDPAVIAIGAALGMDEFAVVGRLHRLWSWANRHLSSGVAQSVTEQWIDRYVSAPGFAAAMLHAGWLRSRSTGVEFPNFDRWNSQGAKRRLTKTQWDQANRPERGHAADGQPTPRRRGADGKPTSDDGSRSSREEKRREEEPPTPGGGGVVVPDDPPEEVVDAAGTMIRPAPFAELVAAWVAAKMPGWNAPDGIQANGHRRGLFEQRQRDPRWRERWRAAVERMGRSKRARGETAGWPTGVRLDWFLKDESYIDRALEGEFDDRPGQSAPPKPPERKIMTRAELDAADMRVSPPHRPFQGSGAHHV